MAVDGQINTFWASKFDDTAEPVEFLIDLGGIFNVEHMEIFWEFPARAFSVLLSSDGDHFTEVFATSANVVSTSHLSVGGKSGRKVRIIMKEVCRRARHKSFDFVDPRSIGFCELCHLLVAASPNRWIVRTFFQQ